MAEKFDFLFKYLKKEGIHVDQNEFNFQIQSHPEYPTLLSISDTLSFFKIKNIAAKIEAEVIKSLPDNFIALVDDKKSSPFLSFIEKNQDVYKYTTDEKAISISSNEFNKLFGNIVLLAEKPESEAKKPENKNSLYILLVIFGIIYLSAVFIGGFYFSAFLFIILSSLGVFLSIEAISHELGISTKFSEAICTTAISTDCDAVINSTKSKLFEFFNFSDTSITFFVAQLLGFLFFSMAHLTDEFYTLTFISLLFSVPVTAFSIYQQKVVVKKWCPICLGIILIIYAEMAGTPFLAHNSISITITSVIYFSFAFVTSFIVSTTLKKLIKNNFKLKTEIAENNRFKRNYSLFKMALLASDKINYTAINSGNIILGNPDATLRIVVILSPFCSHCKSTHAVVKKILELYKDIVAIHIRFHFDAEHADEKSKKVHQKFVNIHLKKGGDTFVKALHEWFSEKDVTKLDAHGDETMDEIKVNAILAEQYLRNKENKIRFTPTIIINDYLFPSQYDKKNLVNFITDLAEDDSIT